MFKLFKKKSKLTDVQGWRRSWTNLGVELSQHGDGDRLSAPLLPAYLLQLQDDGYAIETVDGLLIDWDSIFDAIQSPSYAELHEVLNLPPLTVKWPILQSSNSLADKNFSIAVAGWRDTNCLASDCEIIGPIISCNDSVELMQPAQWRLFQEVIGFARRPPEDRTDFSHRQGWGRIRKLALSADAKLDDFLYRSVVLNPEKLEIGLRKSIGLADDTVIEIEPGFSGAPANWLTRFDAERDVPDRYDIVTVEGIVQVLISPQVKTVLQQIKRLPLRRVAGSRAQAFILNPYATLGEDAKNVIVEEQFEQAREQAGLQYERFLPVIERDATGYPTKVGLLIETANASGPVSSETRWLTHNEHSTFVEKLNASIAHGHQLLGWQGYDFEIQGDTPAHLSELKSALEEHNRPPMMVFYAQVHDLSAYSSRIESIGIEKPYYSPYIAKKKEDEGWFPENVVPIIGYTSEVGSEPIAIPATKATLDQLREAAESARVAGRETVELSWLPKPMSSKEAEDLTAIFGDVLGQVNARQFDPEKHAAERNEKPGARKSLILRANIQTVEYEEARSEALKTYTKEPQLPKNLRPECSLLPHQREGVAWLQHLYSSQAEYQVRGALLADDMGLGKTLQLLTFMARLVEEDPLVDPMLVVAPVSLLENWKEEADKFFLSGTLPILTAYGDSLALLRVPRAAIDARLQTEDGLVRFLKPGWIGNAKVVLTTYETLRDLEFSFAAQRWSLMICDEAQRIKNPAAMVTRASKKQNVAFKIACTGTPVENSLADMWCLFDFVQPGLLGALDDFGKRYRKPIEAKRAEENATTEEDKVQAQELRARIEELRARIAPQILRRLKTEVALNLPEKIIVEACRKLPLSMMQRNLYSKAVEDFKRRNEADSSSPFKNHLGLLQYLRVVCTDPRRHGLTVFKPEPINQYCAKSPKLDWLLKELVNIKRREEKVIVFCEFRNIQRLLQHYIKEAFDINPDIINGDTSASSSNETSRQKRIKSFQMQKGFGVIILSPVAVGFGVNIQGANHVVHYTRTWNPAKEDQATDRAYRIGQTKDVYVYYPVVYAEDFLTFDVKLDQLLTYKRELASDMLNGSGDVSPSDFNVGDVVPPGVGDSIDERINLDMALRMEWRHFEGLTAALWNKRGYDYCYCTPGAHDNGVDVVAITGSKGVLVQTKASGKEGARLGWDAVKEVVAGEAFYRRKYPNVEFKKVGLTNQFFNAQAHEQAELNNVELLDQKHLTSLLNDYPISMLDIERLLYQEWSYEPG